MNYFKDMWKYYFGNKKKFVIVPFNPGKKNYRFLKSFKNKQRIKYIWIFLIA